MSQQDMILRETVDDAFMIYDRNRTGFLDPNQLANFFNELFARFNEPRRFSQQQCMNIMRQIDSNFDGRISKIQLFNAIKFTLNQPPVKPNYGQGGYNQGGYNQGGYNQGGQMGNQGGFNQGGYNQPGYNQGGYNQGGYNQGGFNQGGYNQGGYNQGGYNQGGYNQGGYNQGNMPRNNQNPYYR